MKEAEIPHSQLAVDAAMVASELHAAGRLAKNLSLVAKNTRTLVVRAGNTALGLKVITEHFSDLADETIALTQAINTLAIKITKASVLGWQSDNACVRMARAQKIAEDAPFVASLSSPALKNIQKSNHLNQEFLKMMLDMDAKLEEIRMFMRSTDVISVTFKLEAIQTGSHEKILTKMAAEINSLSEGIKRKVHRSKELVTRNRLAA